MLTLFLLAAPLAAALLATQQAPPATDVWVATLSIADGTFTIGKPENISNSPGYDNQPYFTPDDRAVYFTSARAQGSNQTDIYRYDLDGGRLSQVTSTPESEYSPTPMPDGRHLSVVRVEADSSQRLWKVPIGGGSPSVVLADVKPVGYHAWLDDTTLALFVLGQPATLQVADTRTGKAQIVAKDIGPSIQRIPTGGASFVQQQGEGPERALMIAQVTLASGKAETTPLIAAVPGASQVHLAWTPDGTLLMAHEGSLHAWRRGETTWRVVADLKSLGLEGVTRLAVSPTADRIAFVVAQQQKR